MLALCRVVLLLCVILCLFFFFFNDTATTEIYTLSLHDALPIYSYAPRRSGSRRCRPARGRRGSRRSCTRLVGLRSEEHTSELQSQSNLVCRLLLEKKKKHYIRVCRPSSDAVIVPRQAADHRVLD